MLVAITGANRGIGLELAKLYAKNSHKVVALCRHDSEELNKLDNVKVVLGVDTTNEDLSSILEDAFSAQKVDLFINNAGVLSNESLDHLDLDAIRKQFEVNAIGPINMVNQILKHLGENAKIGIVTSRMGSVGDNDSGGMYGYRMSKAAANAASKSLAMDLRAKGHPVAILHPGYVKTDMTGQNGDITPDEAAQGLAQVLERLSIENTGKFWHQNGQELPW
ncbi:MAG: SDR family oxidoreductase [Bacteriovoracaceae bacterium]|nr:SDR family oxidoreductase [Bacteriovoracaceae bacterium]